MITTEELIKKYGEYNRQIIENAMKFLEVNEPKWNLDTPIDREKYIRYILESTIKSDNT